MTFEQRRQQEQQADYDAFKATEKVKAAADAARWKKLNDDALAQQATQKAAAQKQADAINAKL